MTQKILIIGGTSAIAIACARLWAKQGCELFLVARDAIKLEQTAADLYVHGAKKIITYCMDATNFSDHTNMLEACITNFQEIDIALIAHGTLPDQKKCEQSAEIALQEFTNNGTSVIALLTQLANQFEKQKQGSLAIISSVAGERGRPSNYLYGAAKAAVSTFCEGLRARLFKVGVHVMTIKPGFVDTPMTKGLPLPKILVSTPETIAKCIIAGIKLKKSTIFAPKFWSIIMLIICSIPQPIFKRLNL